MTRMVLTPVFILFQCILLLTPQPSAAFESKAAYVVLMDGDTGSILYEKQGDTLMSPASMSKLMTLNLLFEELQAERVRLSDTFTVSKNAWKKGGAASGSSTMFAKVHSQIPVEDLIRAITVQSGNDACITIAESLMGSEEAFAREMTARARELGLKKAVFTNATGWPDPNHKMTARELAQLARHLIYNHNNFYPYFAEKKFTWNGITQSNRNPLIYLNMGVDGLKTGYTQESGYGLVASGEREGRRLILVVNGLSSERERKEESKKLLEWGWREFRKYELYAAGDIVERAKVWQGAEAFVPLVVSRDVTVMMSREGRRNMTVKATWEGPVSAPVKTGQNIGTLVVSVPGMPRQRFPLLSGSDVGRLGIVGRSLQNIRQIIVGGW